MNTFPCDPWFAVLWTVASFCGGALCLIWVLSMCRSGSRADECAACLRRRAEAEREAQAMRAASAVISPGSAAEGHRGQRSADPKTAGPVDLSPVSITPSAWAFPEEVATARPAGSSYPHTVPSGPLAGAILDSPASAAASIPDVKAGKLTPRMGL
jgi:hypothetical protein